MKITVTESMFKDQFVKMNRAENFSHRGLKALFNYFENLEESCGEEFELDVIGICCDFSEEHYADIADNYGIDLTGCECEEEEFTAVMEHLEKNTSIIHSNENTGIILYQNF